MTKEDFDKRPDPLEIPSAEWLLHHLSDEGDNAGSDYNDNEAVQGYFGWSVITVRHSATEKLIRHELEVWWEPVEDDGPKPQRHTRRFILTPITGQRGATSEEIN